jgi:hypothetical protein
MKVIVNKDSKRLIANKEHRNFTETDELIEEGTILDGNAINVKGLRRGEPFTYRLFITPKNEIIYLNNITPMETTEVMLGADDSVSSTKVNLIPAETFSRFKTIGLVAGGLAGFAYAKYKKQDMKKVAMWIGLGALVGYATAYVVDRNRAIDVTPSK